MENNYEMKTDRKRFQDMDGDDCWIDTMTNFGEVTVEIVIDHDSGAFPMKDAATVREIGEHLIKMAGYMEDKKMSRKPIKVRIIKSPYSCISKSKLPVIAMAWFDSDSGMYQVDADFLPALRKKGISPGDWPFLPGEVEVLE